ncbi:MAG TPA: PSD1 and planctomycete cytochrome C domain-containing protein [Pirellulales bacterium]|nr:PSD1 and planctomycete cytochrome C domain-containing protein [Pirellulales bacterium]
MLLRILLVAILFTLWLPTAVVIADEPQATSPARLSYNRDVRPILSNNCFKCHGPDARERQAELRLDISDEARKPTATGALAIVPGKPDESELVARVFAADEAARMPPPASHKELSDRERETLRRWVAEGAEYEAHWSFIAPKRPELPAVKLSSWPRNAIDRFVLARLEREGLTPSPEADRATLLRRVTLDLTGLPPTPVEVDAFLLDNSAGAYEKVVDRLLASPHYGERLALDWLDAARFADTNGYHIDNGRDMTRWREWVINSFNRNLPFDQFTVEQLAGDLLEGATVDQRIASGFNRNHMINFEGGAIPEEYHTAYIVDRVNTTGTVWLGLSVGCSQCHDHKFDPITQKDYYRLYAFFNNVPEKGLDGQTGNSPPFLKLPTTEQQQKLDSLAATITDLEQQIAGPNAEVDAAQAAWETNHTGRVAPSWHTITPLSIAAEGGATFTRLDDGSYLVTGPNPANDVYTIVFGGTTLPGTGPITALRLEALPDDSLAERGPGRSANGNVVLTQVAASADLGQDIVTRVELKSAWADFSQKDFDVAGAIDDKPETGWALHPEMGKPHTATFALAQPLELPQGSKLTVQLRFQSQFAQHQLGRLRLAVTDAADPREPSALPEAVAKILATAAGERSDAQRGELRTYYRDSVSPRIAELKDQLAATKKSREQLDKSIPTSMVMQEMEKPRDTFMLERGQYDKRGEQVSPGVPAALPPLPEGAPANRLGLARWLVDDAHPLVPRVAANRYWQLFFGTGLVKTAEDFGSQGELPSHPELLDWLAVQLRDGGETSGASAKPWDVKALCRLIVTSATYRQSSHARADLAARDPDNRLLGRAPRGRLIAEFIRDQALAVSGLLDSRIGGPSVSPYQPAGLWEELAFRADGKNWTAQTYTQSHGADLYRRTMYTFWKRTSPPPTLITFDAPDRETCTVRRATTNTPLQALVLLNDPTYVEASRKLAERVMTEAPQSPDERIAFAFRLATARRPSEAEIGVLRRVYEEQLAAYRAHPEAAQKLLAVGEAPRNDKLDAAELAAWTMVASMILNLDETVTKS